MRLWECLEEVRVVEEDRVVTFVSPAVDGVEDRCELVQLVIHCADLVRVRLRLRLRLRLRVRSQVCGAGTRGRVRVCVRACVCVK